MPAQQPWELFFVQHSHIDIGFTHRQEQIEKFRVEFLRQVVEMLQNPAQQQRAPEVEFKYVCEGFWALEKFLHKATSEEVEVLVQGFRSGHLELSPFYFHLTELADEHTFRSSFDKALAFATEHDIRADTAMACDINGFTWGMAQVMYDVGIRYLSTNINSHHGGYPFGQPLKPFYWETPKGDRILSWVGLPYHKGNLLGLVPALNPDSDPGIPGTDIGGSGGYVDVKDIGLAETKVLPMLEGLEHSGYPYRFFPIMGGGLYTDNNPPIDEVCELLAQWNEKHGDQVRIRTATLKEFFTHVEEHAGPLETHGGDWTDWWADGVASTAAETILFRNAQRTRNTILRADPQRRWVGDEELKGIDEQLLLYAEHTWGHTNSNSPWALIVQQSVLRKGKFAVEADERACRALDEVRTGLGEGPFTSHRPFTYRVVNTLPIARKGLAYLPYDAWEVDKVRSGLTVRDKAGNECPYQIDRRLREYFIVVEVELAADEQLDLQLEFAGAAPTDYPLELVDDYFMGAYNGLVAGSDGSAQSSKKALPDHSYENDWLALRWSEEGGIYSLVDKSSGQELLDETAGGLGTPFYQRFIGGQRSAAAGFNLSPRNVPEGTIYRGRLQEAWEVAAGAHSTRLYFRFEVEGAEYWALELEAYHGQPRLDVKVRLTKDNVPDPEGMYAAFPLQLDGGEWALDKSGRAIVPGRDQLPGTCADYYLLQSGAVLSNGERGVALSILDAPLVHVGALRLWNFSTQIEPTGTLYSWLTNNKWEVNFKGACGGFYEFRYVLEWGEHLGTREAALAACDANQYELLVLRTE